MSKWILRRAPIIDGQLANKYDFVSELNVSGFLGLNLPYLSFWAVYRHMATISLVPLFG